jgi:hypothetical protein
MRRNQRGVKAGFVLAHPGGNHAAIWELNRIVEDLFPAHPADGFQSGGMRSPRSNRRYFSPVHAS